MALTVSNSLESYQNKSAFSVSGSVFQRHSSLIFTALSDHITTKRISGIVPFLQANLPGIFLSKCFNDDELPFIEEVTQTETGHLYEHILLEYLVTFTPEKNTDRKYKGLTYWNWKKDPFGTFHIRINVGIKDQILLKNAINASNNLLEEMFTALIPELLPIQPAVI